MQAVSCRYYSGAGCLRPPIKQNRLREEWRRGLRRAPLLDGSHLGPLPLLLRECILLDVHIAAQQAHLHRQIILQHRQQQASRSRHNAPCVTHCNPIARESVHARCTTCLQSLFPAHAQKSIQRNSNALQDPSPHALLARQYLLGPGIVRLLLGVAQLLTKCLRGILSLLQCARGLLRLRLCRLQSVMRIGVMRQASQCCQCRQ